LEDKKSKYSKFKAAALKYSIQEEWATPLPSKGKREKATQIVEMVKKYNIPCSDSPEIIELILDQKINDLIPEKVSVLIEEINNFIYLLEGRKHE